MNVLLTWKTLFLRLAALAAALLALSGCASSPRAAQIEAAAAAYSPLTGHPAPDFALPDQNGQIVRLSDCRGEWVVVYFYPADGTPGCTCQQREFSRSHEQFQALDARVLGISPDSVERHKQVSEQFDLRVTLLADPEKKALEPYGAWSEAWFGGRAVRSTVLIDSEGRIAYHWPEVIPEGHADRVRRKLAEIRRSRDSSF